MLLQRVQTLLVGVWLGLVVALALVAAPTLFKMLDRELAGQVAGAMFRIEAQVSLGLAMALFLIERHRARSAAREGSRLPMTGLLLVLGSLFCTVLGYYGIQPMMEQSKAGLPTPLSFGALHGMSSSFFMLKGVLLAVLLWRLAGRATGSQAASCSAL